MTRKQTTRLGRRCSGIIVDGLTSVDDEHPIVLFVNSFLLQMIFSTVIFLYVQLLSAIKIEDRKGSKEFENDPAHHATRNTDVPAIVRRSRRSARKLAEKESACAHAARQEIKKPGDRSFSFLHVSALAAHYCL
jgi:hypothetical protein